MKNAFVVFILFFVQFTNAQHIVHEIENDDFTGETIIRVQDQRNKGAYDHLSGTSHLFSDFLNWRIEIKSIDKQGDEQILAIFFWSPNDDTYGGLHDADVIFKFLDGSTIRTKVGRYDVDEDSITILGIEEPVYTLWCGIMLAPGAYVDDYLDESGTLLNALSIRKLEAVRMYFGEGYVNFDVPDRTIFKRLLARHKALTP